MYPVREQLVVSSVSGVWVREVAAPRLSSSHWPARGMQSWYLLGSIHFESNW